MHPTRVSSTPPTVVTQLVCDLCSGHPLCSGRASRVFVCCVALLVSAPPAWRMARGTTPALFREITALVEDNVIAHTSSRSPRARDGASNTHDLPTHDTMQDEQNSRTDLSLADLARNHQTQSQPQQPLDAASAENVYLDGTEPEARLRSIARGLQFPTTPLLI